MQENLLTLKWYSHKHKEIESENTSRKFSLDRKTIIYTVAS